jgi:hypothetical protein
LTERESKEEPVCLTEREREEEPVCLEMKNDRK